MHNNTPIVPYISLCSGYEGIGLGLHSCIPNLRCIAYCEREAYAIANLVAKMEKGLLDAAPVFTDVTTFPWEQFAPYMAGGILSFGWPCQPVSMAGKRKATEDERWLFDIIADGISILKPGMLFAENVEGLLSAKMPDGSLVFSHCIERLERLHYKVEAGIFSASEVGAPHQRKRVFILAYREEQGLEGLRRLESDFIWNDASSYGAARGKELGNANNYSDTEAGYAEAHRLSGERGEEVCSGFAGGTDATPWSDSFRELGNAINNVWGDVSRNQCGQEEQPISCISSGNVADSNNSRSGENIQSTKSWTNWIKQSSGNCGGMQSGEIREEQAWPSRPGEQQYAWEPPRVIGAVPAKLADTNNAGWEAGRDHSITSSRGSGSHRSASHCGDQEPAGLEDSKLIGRRGRNNGDEGGLRGEIQAAGSCGSSRETRLEDSNGSRGEEPEHQQASLPTEPSGCNAEAMGNSASERSHRGAQDRLGLQPEVFGEGHENMGDSECVRLEHGREHASMGEASRKTEGSWSESTSSPQEPNASREGEASRSIESQYSEAESSLGRDAYESSIGMDISELSGLSHSELAEIREWMFKTESRTDELRLLGNGVVRSTATRAFLTLFEKLK